MTTYEAKWVNLHSKYVYIHPYVVVHLICLKRLIGTEGVINASVNTNYWNILSAVLWCVASTRTTMRSLITTTPSHSRTELRCLNCTYLWLYDRWATHLLGPPIIHAKAGAVSQWSCVPPSPMSVVAGRTRRRFRYTLSLPHAVDMQQSFDVRRPEAYCSTPLQ